VVSFVVKQDLEQYSCDVTLWLNVVTTIQQNYNTKFHSRFFRVNNSHWTVEVLCSPCWITTGFSQHTAFYWLLSASTGFHCLLSAPLASLNTHTATLGPQLASYTVSCCPSSSSVHCYVTAGKCSTIPAFRHVTTYCYVSEEHVVSIFRILYRRNPADCY
jgi:hypothetical protein